MKRPKLGQKVRAHDRLVRRCWSKPHHTLKNRSYLVKGWRQYGDSILKAKPVEGIYIGYRTYSTGTVHWDSDYGNEYTPEEWYEVWLIVPNVRSRPVPVFPKDVVGP